MRYKVMKQDKAKVIDPTMDEDKTYDNYIALLTAILIDKDHPKYKELVYNKDLFNKEEEKKRLKEIEEIRARGEQTELEIWYKSTFSGKDEEQKRQRISRLFSNLAKKKHKILKAEREKIKEKYKDEIMDISQFDIKELVKYKIKVINIVTGEIYIYNSRDLCSFDTGMEKRNLTTYIKDFKIYKNTYLFTIINEKITHEELEKIKYNKIRSRATNKKTGEVKIFESIKELSDFFEMNYNTFQQGFKSGSIKKIQDWDLERIKEE